MVDPVQAGLTAGPVAIEIAAALGILPAAAVVMGAGPAAAIIVPPAVPAIVMIVPALIAAIPGWVPAIAVPAGIAMIPATIPVTLVTAIIIPAWIAAIAVAPGIAVIAAIAATVPVALVAPVIVPAGTPAISVAVTGLVTAIMIACTAAIAILSARLTVPATVTPARARRGIAALAAGVSMVPAAPLACIPVATIRSGLFAPGFAAGPPVFTTVGIAIAVAVFLPLGVRRRGHRQCGGQQDESDKGGAKQAVLAWCHGTRLRVYAGTDPARLTEG